ncbi:ABC transporter substrate-binding protein [Lapidilactobacillus bayanensis]|uniref:ABC transporter substrate-binding protein n=1 Tax=Lapidilactobacillus bayanensis TaxID=2485998 RepID=UPI001CDBD4AF|nr:sugar ABC transporter substrate-binding protein [Lapidilactobacillus bayanensis]
MSMKKIASLLGVAAVLVGLSACGNSNKKTSSDAKESKTLTVLLSEEPSKTNALNNAFKKWAKETGNKLKTVVIPYDDQLTKFPLMLKNKDVPDIVATTRLMMLYPDEFTDLSKKMDTSIFDEKALKVINQDYTDTKVLGAPNQYTLSCYFYNKDAFKKAGITAPTVDNPWTLDELYANAERLKRDGDVKYGLAVDFSRARYDNLMYSNGGSMVKKDGKTFDVTINSNKNVKTLQKFISLNKSGVMPEVIWTGGSSDNPADYFKNGDVGIYLSGTWNYEPLNTDVSKFDFGVMPSPKGSEQQSVISGGSSLAIPKSAKNSKLAVQFLKWLYKDKNLKEYLTNDKGISFVKDVSYVDKDPDVAADYKILQSELDHVTDQFLVDEQSQWRNYLDNEYRDYLKQAVSGEMSAKGALDAFAQDLSKKSDWAVK